jgi:hypothetical protein
MSSPVELKESPAAPAPASAPAAESSEHARPKPKFTVTTNDVPIPRRSGFALLRVSAGSFVTFGLLAATLVGTRLYFVEHPIAFPLEAESALQWRMLATIASCGLFGLLLAPYARFPDMWEPSVKHRHRLLVPIVWGIVYGLVTVARDLPSPRGDHFFYPASVPFYAYGAVFLEILLRLFGLTLLTWLIGEIFLMGRLRNFAFWVANVVTSLYEPLPHIAEDVMRVERPELMPATIVNWAFHPLFLANLLTGYMYRRLGFLTAVLFRMSFYAVWHVWYGNFWRYGTW